MRKQTTTLDKVLYWIEELKSEAVDDFVESAKFTEYACEYCRELGWKEPD